MTEQEKIVRIAEGVMGWHEENVTTNSVFWTTKEGKWEYPAINLEDVKAWNPLRSWNDAGMVLEKFNGYQLNKYKSTGRYECALPLNDRKDSRVFGKSTVSIMEAICEAALATLEEK